MKLCAVGVGLVVSFLWLPLDARAGEPGPPATALHWADATVESDGVRLSLRPVTDRAWHEAPPEGRIGWDEWPLYWKVRRSATAPDLMAPLVPTSSVQVSIENRGSDALDFSRAQKRPCSIASPNDAALTDLGVRLRDLVDGLAVGIGVRAIG